jgi:monoamine oxidase
MARRLDRRAFLRSALIAPIALPARRRSSAAANPVVIVGAGLAGLHAATLLRQAGKTVVVLEARSEPGGRVRTLRAPFHEGLYGDAGPVRIAGVHRRVIDLAGQHGLTLVPFTLSAGASVVNVGGKVIRIPEQQQDLVAALALTPDEARLGQGGLLQRYVGNVPADLGDPAVAPDAYARWAQYDRLAWPDWLRSRGASDAAVRLMTIGGDSTQLSTLYVLRQMALLRNSTTLYKIQGGMDRLPRAMAKPLAGVIRYEAAVVGVDHGTAPVRIDYVERGRIRRSLRASDVVFTLPFSVLRTIAIQPSFSKGTQRAIDELPYFPGVRFLFESRTRFWDASGFSGSARTDQPAEIWDGTYDVPGARGVLGATVGGDLGRIAGGMERSAAIRFGTELVVRTFPDLRATIDRGAVYRWALDPSARGAFAVFHPGQMISMIPEIARPEGRIHFAGEHTSPWTGWMEGALESAERVVNEILT